MVMNPSSSKLNTTIPWRNARVKIHGCTNNKMKWCRSDDVSIYPIS